MRKEFCLGIIAACAVTACSAPQQVPMGEVVSETYIHKYGAEVPSHDWESRGQNGTVVTTLNNGVVVSKGYSEGVLEGDATYTYPHSSTVEKVETYYTGNLQRDVVFYPHGTPMQETRYNSKGKNVTTWYENGNPKGLEEYDAKNQIVSGEYYDINHQKDSWIANGEGSRIVRDPYGQMQSKDLIQNGSVLTNTTYHPNGMPKEVTPYKEGRIDGQRKAFLPGGEPHSVEEWADGKKHGTTVLYQNGEKVAEVPYTNGAKNGLERRYRDGNTVVEEISWVNDNKHGPSKTYLGSTPKTDWYFQGQPVTKKNFEMMQGPLANPQ